MPIHHHKFHREMMLTISDYNLIDLRDSDSFLAAYLTLSAIS